MFLGEFLEAVFDDVDTQLVIRVGVFLLKPFELDEQAFLQIGRTDAGRVEQVNDVQHLSHLFFGGLEVHGKKQVVNDVADGAAQIPVVVEVADDHLPDDFLLFGEVVVAQLLDEVVLERILMGDGGLVFLVVAAVVVGLQLVGVVVFVVVGEIVSQVELLVFVEVELVVVVVVVLSVVVAFSAVVVVLLGRAVIGEGLFFAALVVFEGGVRLDFFFDALFELDKGQLQQFHQLNLLG